MSKFSPGRDHVCVGYKHRWFRPSFYYVKWRERYSGGDEYRVKPSDLVYPDFRKFFGERFRFVARRNILRVYITLEVRAEEHERDENGIPISWRLANAHDVATLHTVR